MLKVKIDTKEKFHVLDIPEHILSANMTEELNHVLRSFLENDIKNVVLKLTQITQIDHSTALYLATIQQLFYDNNASFVICEIKPAVAQYLDELGLLDVINVTPTESEAWDIIQLEEIERELLND